MLKLESKWATKTSTGILSKGIYSNGKEDFLVKGNSSPNNKEPYSEAISSIIADNLNLENIRYYLRDAKEFKEIKVFGSCDKVCICKKYDKPLYQFCSQMELKYSDIRVSNFLEIYIKEGLSIDFLITLFVFDAFIGNKDRHLNNFDFIRNDNKTISNAPILDCGASLLYDIPERDLKVYRDTQIGPDKAKPLKETHREQIHLLNKKFGIPILFKLSSKEEFLSNVFNDAEEVFQYLSFKRVEAIKSYLSSRYDVYVHPYVEYIESNHTKFNSLSWSVK